MNRDQVRQDIIAAGEELTELLLAKNDNYGNSALDPIRVFSRADAIEQLLVRIDDKLSRIQRTGHLAEGTLIDLEGYVRLLRVALKQRERRGNPLENAFKAEDGASLYQESAQEER